MIYGDPEPIYHWYGEEYEYMMNQNEEIILFVELLCCVCQWHVTRHIPFVVSSVSTTCLLCLTVLLSKIMLY